MWADLQQEEMRRAFLKSSISDNSNRRSKGVKEEEDVALASKGPSQEEEEELVKGQVLKVWLVQSLQYLVSSQEEGHSGEAGLVGNIHRNRQDFLYVRGRVSMFADISYP